MEATYLIEPTTITDLVPTRLTRGDRDLWGAPLVWVTTTLRVAPDRRRLVADVYFRIMEDKPDWTTAEQSWADIEVWLAPPGRLIQGFRGTPTSTTHFRGSSAGIQILAPTEDWLDALGVANKINEVLKPILTAINPVAGIVAGGVGDGLNALQSGLRAVGVQGNTAHVVIPRGGDGVPFGPVAFFTVVGDTGGNDISTDTNPKDDTRIVAIKFRQIEVTVDDEATTERRPLFSWWSAARRDNFATTNPHWAGRPGEVRADHDGYGFVRVEGALFSPDRPQPAGMVPIHLWWHPERADNMLASDLDDRRVPPDIGYGWAGLQGYAFSPGRPQPPGTLPLCRWYSEARGDHFTTTLPDWRGNPGDVRTDHEGYRFIRVEGFVYPS